METEVHRDLKLENVVLHKERGATASRESHGPLSVGTLPEDASAVAKQIDALGVCKIVDFDTVERLNGARNTDVMGTYLS